MEPYDLQVLTHTYIILFSPLLSLSPLLESTEQRTE